MPPLVIRLIVFLIIPSLLADPVLASAGIGDTAYTHTAPQSLFNVTALSAATTWQTKPLPSAGVREERLEASKISHVQNPADVKSRYRQERHKLDHAIEAALSAWIPEPFKVDHLHDTTTRDLLKSLNDFLHEETAAGGAVTHVLIGLHAVGLALDREARALPRRERPAYRSAVEEQMRTVWMAAGAKWPDSLFAPLPGENVKKQVDQQFKKQQQATEKALGQKRDDTLSALHAWEALETAQARLHHERDETVDLQSDQLISKANQQTPEQLWVEAAPALYESHPVFENVRELLDNFLQARAHAAVAFERHDNVRLKAEQIRMSRALTQVHQALGHIAGPDTAFAVWDLALQEVILASAMLREIAQPQRADQAAMLALALPDVEKRLSTSSLTASLASAFALSAVNIRTIESAVWPEFEEALRYKSLLERLEDTTLSTEQQRVIELDYLVMRVRANQLNVLTARQWAEQPSQVEATLIDDLDAALAPHMDATENNSAPATATLYPSSSGIWKPWQIVAACVSIVVALIGGGFWLLSDHAPAFHGTGSGTGFDGISTAHDSLNTDLSPVNQVQIESELKQITTQKAELQKNLEAQQTLINKTIEAQAPQRATVEHELKSVEQQRTQTERQLHEQENHEARVLSAAQQQSEKEAYAIAQARQKQEAAHPQAKAEETTKAFHKATKDLHRAPEITAALPGKLAPINPAQEPAGVPGELGRAVSAVNSSPLGMNMLGSRQVLYTFAEPVHGLVHISTLENFDPIAATFSRRPDEALHPAPVVHGKVENSVLFDATRTLEPLPRIHDTVPMPGSVRLSQPGARARILDTDDRDYFVEIEGADFSKPLHVQIDMGHLEDPVSLHITPGPGATASMESLPPEADTQAAIDTALKLPTFEERMHYIGNWITDNFEHTIDPKHDAIHMASPGHYIHSIDKDKVTIVLPDGKKMVVRVGICNTSASFAIDMFRRMGYAARYMAGNSPRDQTELSTWNAHAWVEIFDPQKGWVELDTALWDRVPNGIENQFDENLFTDLQNHPDPAVEKAIRDVQKLHTQLAQMSETRDKTQTALNNTESKRQALQKKEEALAHPAALIHIAEQTKQKLNLLETREQELLKQLQADDAVANNQDTPGSIENLAHKLSYWETRFRSLSDLKGSALQQAMKALIQEFQEDYWRIGALNASDESIAPLRARYIEAFRQLGLKYLPADQSGDLFSSIIRISLSGSVDFTTPNVLYTHTQNDSRKPGQMTWWDVSGFFPKRMSGPQPGSLNQIALMTPPAWLPSQMRGLFPVYDQKTGGLLYLQNDHSIFDLNGHPLITPPYEGNGKVVDMVSTSPGHYYALISDDGKSTKSNDGPATLAGAGLHIVMTMTEKPSSKIVDVLTGELIPLPAQVDQVIKIVPVNGTLYFLGKDDHHFYIGDDGQVISTFDLDSKVQMDVVNDQLIYWYHDKKFGFSLSETHGGISLEPAIPPQIKNANPEFINVIYDKTLGRYIYIDHTPGRNAAYEISQNTNDGSVQLTPDGITQLGDPFSDDAQGYPIFTAFAGGHMRLFHLGSHGDAEIAPGQLIYCQTVGPGDDERIFLVVDKNSAHFEFEENQTWFNSHFQESRHFRSASFSKTKIAGWGVGHYGAVYVKIALENGSYALHSLRISNDGKNATFEDTQESSEQATDVTIPNTKEYRVSFAEKIGNAWVWRTTGKSPLAAWFRVIHATAEGGALFTTKLGGYETLFHAQDDRLTLLSDANDSIKNIVWAEGHIYYVSRDNHLYELSLDGQKAVVSPANFDVETNLAVDSAGHVIYAGHPHGQSTTAEVRMLGKNKPLFAQTEVSAHSVMIGTDGIIYLEIQDRRWVRLGPHPVWLPESITQTDSPLFGPDGTFYIRGSTNDKFGYFTIDGTKVSAANADNADHLVFGPDGSGYYTASLKSGVDRIYRLNDDTVLDSGKHLSFAVTDDGTVVVRKSFFSPDNKFIMDKTYRLGSPTPLLEKGNDYITQALPNSGVVVVTGRKPGEVAFVNPHDVSLTTALPVPTPKAPDDSGADRAIHNHYFADGPKNSAVTVWLGDGGDYALITNPDAQLAQEIRLALELHASAPPIALLPQWITYRDALIARAEKMSGPFMAPERRVQLYFLASGTPKQAEYAKAVSALNGKPWLEARAHAEFVTLLRNAFARYKKDHGWLPLRPVNTGGTFVGRWTNRHLSAAAHESRWWRWNTPPQAALGAFNEEAGDLADHLPWLAATADDVADQWVSIQTLFAQDGIHLIESTTFVIWILWIIGAIKGSRVEVGRLATRRSFHRLLADWVHQMEQNVFHFEARSFSLEQAIQRLPSQERKHLEPYAREYYDSSPMQQFAVWLILMSNGLIPADRGWWEHLTHALFVVPAFKRLAQERVTAEQWEKLEILSVGHPVVGDTVLLDPFLSALVQHKSKLFDVLHLDSVSKSHIEAAAA